MPRNKKSVGLRKHVGGGNEHSLIFPHNDRVVPENNLGATSLLDLVQWSARLVSRSDLVKKVGTNLLKPPRLQPKSASEM